MIELENGRFAKDCPDCGNQQTYLRKNYAEASLRENKLCKPCSNKKTENCRRGIYRGVNITWLKKFQNNANLRGLIWDITIDDVADAYEQQLGFCVLTGWPVGWAEVGQIHTASIDRIDSDFGYVVDNIQIVHKMVNMMKQQYTQQEFINVCLAVANNAR